MAQVCLAFRGKKQCSLDRLSSCYYVTRGDAAWRLIVTGVWNDGFNKCIKCMCT